MRELRGGRSSAIGGRVKGPASTSIATRPPPGPARGGVAAPAWLVAALTVALVLVAVASLLRARGVARRRK